MSNIKTEMDVDNPNKRYGLKATLAQILATLAQSFLLIGLGMELTMPTVVIQEVYQNSKSQFSLTPTEVSWYGSVLYVFHPIGSFISGFLQERFGRKRCMIFANVPSIFGWILLYYSHTTISLYTSTVLMGMSIGFSEAPILSYVGEITEPKLRGSMTSLASMTSMLGSLIVFTLRYYFSNWRTVALLSTLCPLTCICLILLIPESPIWLVGKGKIEKAEKALCWLRGWVDSETIKSEYCELIRYNELSGTRGNDGKVNTGDTGLFVKLREFKDPAVYRPLRLVMVLFLISNMISLAPCKPFINNIMTEIGILDDQNLILVCSGVLQFIGCLSVMLLIRYSGKRIMSLSSFSISTVLVLLFGVYIVALKSNYIVSTPWIPITIYCGISYFSTSAVGLPWMLISEIFPNKSRGLASGTCAGLGYLLMFVLTKSYLPVKSFLSLEYSIFIFGIIGVFGIVIVYFCLPETENKTLLEIENFFLKN
ncbi:Sugar transporter, conserved site,Major facilitator superfamily domain,Major facilitator, sugar [Cinara cedri]|uniref:Sugar transporter, conserved site,Major facilitator superfamily domain,Major facilitator, sugar n=1 Tax=Cinara cedri TaxID=506608 RepID=A0A5E4M479_9HEMI|nr:Sugar transporter, conserved site,Major facilitator superfamily domain,Major facilitator, sugar [Cinara cedri]